LFIGNKKCRIYAACGVSQTPIKSILREENRILGKNKMILLLILVFSLGCAGCTEKNPAAEQGELVKNERLSEQFGSLSRC